MADGMRDKRKAPLTYKKLEEIFKFKIHKLDNLEESGIDFSSTS